MRYWHILRRERNCSCIRTENSSANATSRHRTRGKSNSTRPKTIRWGSITRTATAHVYGAHLRRTSTTHGLPSWSGAAPPRGRPGITRTRYRDTRCDRTAPSRHATRTTQSRTRNTYPPSPPNRELNRNRARWGIPPQDDTRATSLPTTTHDTTAAHTSHFGARDADIRHVRAARSPSHLLTAPHAATRTTSVPRVPRVGAHRTTIRRVRTTSSRHDTRTATAHVCGTRPHSPTPTAIRDTTAHRPRTSVHDRIAIRHVRMIALTPPHRVARSYSHHDGATCHAPRRTPYRHTLRPHDRVAA
jgi:hypothetical protein